MGIRLLRRPTGCARQMVYCKHEKVILGNELATILNKEWLYVFVDLFNRVFTSGSPSVWGND